MVWPSMTATMSRRRRGNGKEPRRRSLERWPCNSVKGLRLSRSPIESLLLSVFLFASHSAFLSAHAHMLWEREAEKKFYYDLGTKEKQEERERDKDWSLTAQELCWLFDKRCPMVQPSWDLLLGCLSFSPLRKQGVLIRHDARSCRWRRPYNFQGQICLTLFEKHRTST